MIAIPQNYSQTILKNTTNWKMIQNSDNRLDLNNPIDSFFMYLDPIAEINRDGGKTKYFLIHLNSSFAFMCEYYSNDLIMREIRSFNISLKEILLSSNKTECFQELIKVVLGTKNELKV